MEPVPDELLPGGGLALGDLVLVVWEHEVDPAAVEVEAGPEQLEAHRRALEVPAGTPGAEGRIPRGLIRLRSLPEHEVRDVLLVVLVGVDPGPRQPSFDRGAREHPVAGEGGDPEVDGPAGAVGRPGREQPLHHPDHRRDVLGIGGPGVVLGPTDAERVGVLVVLLDVARRVLPERLARLVRSPDRLVVHVREVLRLDHPVTPGFEEPAEDVLRDERAEVPDVAAGVDGEPAGVHPHLVRPGRLESLDASGQGVPQAERPGGTHRASSPVRRSTISVRSSCSARGPAKARARDRRSPQIARASWARVSMSPSMIRSSSNW